MLLNNLSKDEQRRLIRNLKGRGELSEDEIYERIEQAISKAHKHYWVPETFNGRDEYRCDDLTFTDFRDRVIFCYNDEFHNQLAWSYDIRNLNRDYIADLMNDRINGINKYRHRLGRHIDQRMEEIIIREADATKDSRNPRTYSDFVVKRVPFIFRIANNYNAAAESVKDKKLGSKYTTLEWYKRYRDLHRQAYLSSEHEKELLLPEYSKRPGYDPDASTKQPTKKPSKKPTPHKHHEDDPVPHKKVYDKDIAYPFKSKINRYRKDHPEEDVLFIETPTQTRIDYKHIQRPYFSNTRGAWEIDHCFNMARPGDKWMFCININTRYLVVYEIPEKADRVLESLTDLHKHNLVTSVRGDGSTSYCPMRYQDEVLTPSVIKNILDKSKHHNTFSEAGVSYGILDWAMDNGITLYFNSGKFTLHNKMIDVAIKTIRNAIGYRVLKPGQLQQIVDYYNNTVHKSIGCTPVYMHSNPEVEYQYIRWCERKLDNVIDTQREQRMLEYQRGNILMVHIDTGKTTEKLEKRRSFYDRIGEFLEYVHGNVKVRLDVPIKISSGGTPVRIVVVPIYHTKFVAKNRSVIPENVKDYYVVDAYVDENAG